MISELQMVYKMKIRGEKTSVDATKTVTQHGPWVTFTAVGVGRARREGAWLR